MPTTAQPFATSALPARKPLYLMSHARARMEAGTGQLVLHRDDGPTMRFPMARICRIICNRQLSWTGEALALCMTEGVPITWVDGHGHALGATQTCHAPNTTFSTLIETYLELPDWAHRLANWRARRRLETLVTTAKSAAEAGHAPSAADFQELKREYVYTGCHPVVFAAEGEAWCHALAVDHLQREGLSACYWGFDASRLELAEELAALIWAELNLDCGALPTAADQGVVVARLFEAWVHRHAGRLSLHLGDLKRHMAREIESWH